MNRSFWEQKQQKMDTKVIEPGISYSPSAPMNATKVASPAKLATEVKLKSVINYYLLKVNLFN